eukprot:gene39877-18873_t
MGCALCGAVDPAAPPLCPACRQGGTKEEGKEGGSDEEGLCPLFAAAATAPRRARCDRCGAAQPPPPPPAAGAAAAEQPIDPQQAE